MNKTIIGIIILVVVIVSGYFLKSSGALFSGQAVSQRSSDSVSPGSTTSAPIAQEAPSDQNSVTYTDAGYSPSVLVVKVGTTVTFKNLSLLSMWPASGSHPTHGDYPTTGGCLGSTFDACKGIQPGDSWSFQFDRSGTWKYHDHLEPSHFGTIVVE
jgi:plastocyanin